MSVAQYYGTGRRKESVARVYLRPGTGQIKINSRTFEDYFPQATLRLAAEVPLVLTEQRAQFDVIANIKGGGLTGQAGALRLGIARALIQFNPELRGTLKPEGLLTRDAREVERKKYGQPGARKRFQFSKR